ncbi:calcium-binding and coiled-coil domain-containing protein 2-like [Temnothorax curvispinosus]|uniref:Calcium-binding and coiled-coil domain-containing protein 2-like n=1 Tax=Temnothorax curvispinosus TaxID=300111 RepID=A0A6J1PGY4_9HYME|nr:calcium-binding and coiled-coil domain-containing protein 2-like [Temnothorax curvispinosus]
MGYGVEIWGWEEKEGMERLEERYLRWVLGVDRRTPGYLVREELQREKLRGRAGRRVWKFGRRLEEGGGSELARRCWEEVKEKSRRRGRLSDWEEGRKKYLSDRGLWEEGEGEKKGEQEARLEEMVKWEREVQRAERWERIKESRYSKWYKKVKKEGIPEYLKKGWGESR